VKNKCKKVFIMQKLFICAIFTNAFLMVGCANKIEPPEFSPIDAEYTEPNNSRMTAVTSKLIDPYNNVCHLKTLREYPLGFGSTFTGSAALLSNGVLLTAAHNFYKPWYPSTVTQYAVNCGFGVVAGNEGFSFYAKKEEDVRTTIPASFRFHDYDNDLALVATCQREQETKFRLPKNYQEVIKLIERPVTLAGFPAESDKSSGGVQLSGSQMFHGIINLDKTNQFCTDQYGDTLRYARTNPPSCLDTYGGQSGSPLWVKSSDDYVIVGVHVAEATAVMLTQEKIDWLNNKIGEMTKHCNK
tara:strand:- start:1325 stop:2224 length:900 start_codon:yes stop_codon:yes gene_type:complete